MNLQASIRIPRRARDGDTGKGISEVKDFYGLSSSETSEPTEWFSYIPNKPADKYLWNYEKIIYTDGTSTDTKKRVIQGKDARSIQFVVNAYAYSASDTVSPTKGWMSTIESLGVKPDGYFLWVRDDITYTDGTSSSTKGYVVKDGKDGTDGKDGQDGHSPYIGENGNWWIWDYNQDKFIDSGDPAHGDDGRSPEIRDGYWWVYENGEWSNTGVKARGTDGKDSKSDEFIFIRNNNSNFGIASNTPTSLQQDDYVPPGWTDDPMGVSPTLEYEWVSTRKFRDNIWGAFSTPSIWNIYVTDGEDGKDSKSDEFIFRRNNNPNFGIADNKPYSSPYNDDYQPAGWSDDPTGVTYSEKYEWVCKRIFKVDTQTWSEFSIPSLWANWSEDGKSPYVGENGNWYVWDSAQGKYVDSGDPSHGDDGKSPEIRNGYWWAWDGENWYNTGIKAKGEDGKDGEDGASVEFGFRLSDTNSAPAKPTGSLPNASWTYTMPLMTTYYRYLWITKRTKPQGSSTWSVWDTPVLHAYLPKDGEPGVGIPGTPGLPGQIPIQKEWVVGDTHRNTDEIVDFIYVRGADKNTSYWYKLASKGTNDDVGAPPSHGTTPSGYERIDWLKELAVKVLIAEEANVAGFIHKSEKLFSQSGETYAGIPLAIDEYIEYNFANTASQPTVSSTSWTDLPTGTIQWVRYKKNTESTWTVNRVGISANQWQLQFATQPEGETWYSSYSTNRFWMRYKTTDDDNYGKAVKITTAGGVDFIPNILIDGVTGRIEMLSAKIRGTIEALSGKIGGFSLENMGLLSDNKLFYIDALNGAIYLLDENGDVKTSIIPYDLPSTPEAFFAESGGGSLSLVALQGSYSIGQTKTTNSFTIDVSGGKQFSLLIPKIKGSVYTDYTALAGETSGSSHTTIYFELMRGSNVHLVLSQPTALSTGGLISETFTIQQRTIQISSSGVYSLRARVETNVTPSNHNATGGASVSVISSPAEFIAIVNRSQIGNNGMIIASSTTRYDYMVGDKHIVRRGNYGFRITENGLQKSNNMNASTPTWKNIEQLF